MTTVSTIEDNIIFSGVINNYIDAMDEFTLVGSYGSFEQAQKEFDEGSVPDVILMDIELPGKNGILATSMLKKDFPKLDIVMMTVFNNPEKIFSALRAGACGYLTKNIKKEELERALTQVKNGGSPMSNSIARLVVDSFQLNKDNPLSKREQEVLTLLAQGKTYSSIAQQLYIAKTTVRAHIRNIYDKLHVNSKEEAIGKANRNSYI